MFQLTLEFVLPALKLFMTFYFGLAASKRLIVSESLSDLSHAKRSKAGWDLDSPRVTPPGTPPPPYGGASSSLTPASERTESSSATGDTTDESALLLDEVLILLLKNSFHKCTIANIPLCFVYSADI